MIITYFKKIPPSISVPLFYFYMSGLLVIKFLFTSTYGALVIALSLYFYLDFNTSITPLTASQLMDNILLIPMEYKVALVSASVTVAGFVIAFHTASINWQNQMRAHLKIEAAAEIESFFAVVLSNITTTKLYVESLVKTVNKIQKGIPVEEASFKVEYIQGKAQEFMAARDILSNATVEVHRLIGKNNNILSTGWGMMASISLAANSLSNLSNSMWVHIPIVNLDDPDHIQKFINQVNITECSQFIGACESNSGKISGLTGGVRGYLTSPIWGVTLPMYVNLISSRKEFLESVKGFHRDLNN